MAVILVSGSALRVTFKAHYMTRDAKKFAAEAFAKASDQVTDAQAADFMKEFCNLTAGGIKLVLEVSKIPVGISLPLTTRGFDEIFDSQVDEPTAFMTRWCLVSAEAKIWCSATIEIYDSARLQAADLKITDTDEKAPGGDIEFL
jgi:hypothetical protein